MTDPRAADDAMPTLLEVAAPEVSTDGVVDAVLDRVARRTAARTRRRLVSAVGVAAAAVLVTIGVVAVFAEGRDADVRTADGPPPSTSTTSAPEPGTGGRGRELDRVAIPGTGDLVVPLANDATGFWVARGSSSGNFGSGPHTITRVGLDGRLGPRTRVDGIPVLGLSFGDLWVVVVEPAREGEPEWRLKRIRPSDGFLLASIPVPLSGKPWALDGGVADPTGNIVVIETAIEQVTVVTRDNSVSVAAPTPTGPDSPEPPAEAPVAERDGRAWWVEGTDVVAREVER